MLITRYISILIFFAFVSCHDKAGQLEQLEVPTNLSLTTEIDTSGSGIVQFQASADNAMSYHFYFDNSPDEQPQVSMDGQAENTYRKSGLNTYLVRVVAFGRGGISSSITEEIEVRVDFRVPQEIIDGLTGGISKTWYWSQSVPGHLGVGPTMDASGQTVSEPIWYAAAPDEKASEGCLYEDEMTFTLNGDGSVTYVLDNKGSTYFHTEELEEATGIPSSGVDQCADFVIGENSSVLFSQVQNGVEPSTNVQMQFTNNGFMSYYVNSSSYEIMSITEDELRVRVIQSLPDIDLAWYHIFTSEDGLVGEDPCESAITGNTGSGNMDELVWSEEFDYSGEPCSKNWNFDIGTGNWGWGNNESQYYTDRPENVIVENGILTITAKKENYQGSEYTSARIKTQDKFSFQYGKVEVRAKLPKGGGTWPAIWMLGDNFPNVGWPDCGEIDIMEHVGNNQNTVHGTLHYPGNSGGNGPSGTINIPDASEAFHNYQVAWNSEEIIFSVDDQPYFTIRNEASMPFDHPFFIILNVAMGGNFGGQIDPGFEQSSMEIDYVRVYQ